jgi:hypothetical protein
VEQQKQQEQRRHAMKWLLSTINEQIDFSPEIELLVALKKLRNRGISLRDVLSGLFRADGDLSFAGYPELSKQEQKEIESLLSSLPDLLKAAFGHDLNDYPEELQFLGQSFAGLSDGQTGFSWQLFNRTHTGERKAIDGLLFKLAGGASSGIRIQANPTLPEGIPSSILEPSTLSLAFQGAMHADAEVEGRGSSMSLRLGSKISAEAELQYYFGHSSDTIVANALLTSLRHLKSPFDITDIYSEIQDGKHLNAIRLTAQASMGFEGQIGFANAVATGKGGEISAGIDAHVGFTLSESGRFDYLITKAEGLDHLFVRVTRAHSGISQVTESLDIVIDMTHWAKRVYPEIRDHLSACGDLLEEAKTLLPGSETIQNTLKEALQTAIKESNLKDEIKGALGSSSGERIDTIISNKLLPQLEATTAIWQENTLTAARSVVAELFDSVDLSTDIENKLQLKLEKKLKSAFDDLHAGLKQEAGAIIDRLPTEELEKKLQAIGAGIDARIRQAADKTAELTRVMREQLDIIQQRLARLKKPFEDASKAKILFKHEALRREEDGRNLDIQFTLNPRHADAQEVLTEILSARLGPYLVNKRSEAILNISGNYNRYKEIVESKRFNVVLFGLGFNSSTETRIRSIFTVDPQGNIQAITGQEWEKRYGRSVDIRRLTFANAREINASRNFQDITVNFGLSMEDKELQAEELVSYLLPFEQLGLLRTGVTARAVGYIGTSRAGHVELGLALTTEQLDRMILKAEANDGDEVLRIGAEIFEQLVTRQPPNITFRDLLPGLLDALSNETHSELGTVSQAIQGWSVELKQKAMNLSALSAGNGVESLRLEELITWLDARHTALVGTKSYCGSWSNDDTTLPGRVECSALVEARPGMVQFLKAIAGIRRQKLAIEDIENDTQLLDALNQRQMAMNLALKNWHSHGQDTANWWLYQEREPRLFSMALFLLLARLSQNNSSTALPTLSASITFTQSNNARERIPLT